MTEKRMSQIQYSKDLSKHQSVKEIDDAGVKKRNSILKAAEEGKAQKRPTQGGP